MNSHEKNSLEVLMIDARILDAKIEIVDKYATEIYKTFRSSCEELASLRRQKILLEATAKSITGQ